mgnify:CR=1 FL=1
MHATGNTMKNLNGAVLEGAQVGKEACHFERFRAPLLARLATLQGQVQAHRDQLTEPAAATSNTFVAGSEVDADDEREVVLLQRAQLQCDEVQAALARLDNHTYGVCARCAEPIGVARLSALPEAHLCLVCQREDERQHGR